MRWTRPASAPASAPLRDPRSPRRGRSAEHPAALTAAGRGVARQAAIGVLLLLGSLAGAAPDVAAAEAARGGGAPGSSPERRIAYRQHLLANVSNTERYVVAGVCETVGVGEIAGLLRRSPLEEMWAFLPRAPQTGECEWHEIGREETSESDGAYVRVDKAYLNALMADNVEIHLYHFHPLRYFECAASADCPPAATADEDAAPDERWITDLVFSMPSPSDIYFMMDATSRFHRYHQGQGSIAHRVVTPYGVVDYRLTAAGLAKFNAERLSRSEGLYITWMVGSALSSERVALVANERPGDIAAAVEKLAGSLNTPYLRVVYQPFAASADAGP